MPRSGVQLCDASVDHAVGTVEQVLVIIWRVRTLVSAVDAISRAYDALIVDCPEGIGLLNIVEQTAPMPTSDARERIAAFLRESTGIKASAVAFEGTGFRAAAVRSVVAGLSLLARQPFPHKIFPTLETASDWLVPELKQHVQVDYDAASFIREVQRLRLEVEVKSPSKSEASA